MPRQVDHAAKEIALRRHVLPECLHVPIAAVDEAAIVDFVGDITEVLVSGSPNKALLVKTDPPPLKDPRLPIWNEPQSAILFERTQIWVHAEFAGYRRAYKRGFPGQEIAGKVLSHCMNRRHSMLKGFQFVRIVPTSRTANSSSAFSESWGIEINSKPRELQSFIQRSARIQYADLADLMVMMDMKVGGGVMELVNQAQQLISPRR